MTVYSHDIVDITLSDYSKDADIVAYRLSDLKLFHNVQYLQSKDYLYKEKNVQHLLDALFIKSENCTVYKFIWDKNIVYDLIVYYNIDLILWKICLISIKNGIMPCFMRMEEGLLSYADLNIVRGYTLNILSKICNLTHQFEIFGSTKTVALYNPDIFDDRYGRKKFKIPELKRENKEIIENLNYVFNYKPKEHNFKKKYIYFSTSTDLDGHPVGEMDLVMKLAKIVGKDNILIKMHPRDNRTVYKDNGFVVDNISAVPWELIQLNHTFENNVFVSLSSGGIINATAMLNDDIKAFFLFPCVKGRNKEFDNRVQTEIVSTLNQLKENKIGNNIQIVDNIQIFKGN